MAALRSVGRGGTSCQNCISTNGEDSSFAGLIGKGGGNGAGFKSSYFACSIGGSGGTNIPL